MSMFKYGMFDAQGRLLVVADSLKEAVDEARSVKRPVYAAEEVAAPAEKDLRSNPKQTPIELAYKVSGLPERIRSMYGKRYKALYGSNAELDYLTADLVFSFSVEEAYAKIRRMLPAKQKWQGKNFQYEGFDKAPAFTGSELGFLADNAKLEAGQVLGNVEAVCKGLALAPHSFGLRPTGEWKRDRYTSNADPLQYTPTGVVAAPDLFTEAKIDALASTISGDNAQWLDLPGPRLSATPRKLTTCAFATGGEHGCRRACLAFSGQNSSAREPTISKIAFTRAFLAYPAEFMRVLVWCLQKYFAKGGRDKKNAYFVRLNVYSDIPWERLFPELFNVKLGIPFMDHKKSKGAFTGGAWKRVKKVGKGSFYDYTKVPRRHEDFLAPYLAEVNGLTLDQARKEANKVYWLTFSFSGTATNLKEARRVADSGGTVAAVFIRLLGDGAPSSRELRHALEFGGKSRSALVIKDLAAYKALRKRLRDNRGAVSQADTDLRLKVEVQRGKKLKTPKKYGSKLPPASAFPMKVKVLPAPFYRFRFQFPGSGPRSRAAGNEYVVINGDANDVRGFDRDILKVQSNANIVGLDYKIPRIALGVQYVGFSSLNAARTRATGTMTKKDTRFVVYDDNVSKEMRPQGSQSALSLARKYDIRSEDGKLETSAVEVAEALKEMIAVEAPANKVAYVKGETRMLSQYSPDSVFISPLVEVGPDLYLRSVIPPATGKDSGVDEGV